MRKLIVDICVGLGFLGAYFSFFWFWGVMGDPGENFLIPQIPLTTAKIIGGVALTSLALAWLVSRIKTGEERTWTRLHNHKL